MFNLGTKRPLEAPAITKNNNNSEAAAAASQQQRGRRRRVNSEAAAAASFASRLPDDVITQLLPLLTLADARALLLTARSTPRTARAALLAVARATLRRALCPLGAALRKRKRARLLRQVYRPWQPRAVAAARALLQREQSAVQREEAALAVSVLCARAAGKGGADDEAAPLRLLQLLLAGADPDLVEGGTTPLHWAALHGRAELATLLLTAGAAAELKDGAGHTPLQIADACTSGRGHVAFIGAPYRRAAREARRAAGAAAAGAAGAGAAAATEAAATAAGLCAIDFDILETLAAKAPGPPSHALTVAEAKRFRSDARVLRGRHGSSAASVVAVLERATAAVPVATAPVVVAGGGGGGGGGGAAQGFRLLFPCAKLKPGTKGPGFGFGSKGAFVAASLRGAPVGVAGRRGARRMRFGSKGAMMESRVAERRCLRIHAQLDEADALLLLEADGAAVPAARGEGCAGGALTAPLKRLFGAAATGASAAAAAPVAAVAAAAAAAAAAPAGELAFGLELFPPRSAAQQQYFEGMLEYGFDQSVVRSIRDAARREGAFAPPPRRHRRQVGWRTVECATHALAAKEPGSRRHMDACVSYRQLLLREGARGGAELRVCEVLFMAVHKHAKRRGIASRLVGALRQRLLQEAAGAPAALCVSLKSASAEARSFWAHAGLAQLDGARPAPAPDAAVVRAMVPFDDFCPFGALVGGAASLSLSLAVITAADADAQASAAVGATAAAADADFRAALTMRAADDDNTLGAVLRL